MLSQAPQTQNDKMVVRSNLNSSRIKSITSGSGRVKMQPRQNTSAAADAEVLSQGTHQMLNSSGPN